MKIKLKYRVGSFLTENSDERKLSWENICRHFLAGSQQFQFSIQFNFEWTFATTCLVISELSTQSFLLFFFWNLVMFWRCIYHICYCFPHRTNCCIGQHNHHSFLAAIITFVVTGLWGVYLSFFTICTSKDNSIFHVDCSDVYANSR